MEPTTSADLETVAAEKSEILSQEAQDRKPEIQALATGNDSSEASRGVKRPADDNEGPDKADEMEVDGGDESNDVDITTEADKPLSKNQLRKLKRRKLWEDQREDRKEKRKEKRHNKQERKRIERETEIAQAAEEGREPVLNQQRERNRNPQTKTPVPVTVILDCQFEEYMFEKEQISLSSQVTRCYSDNRMATHPINLCISSYGGKMQERFETTLKNHHQKWKGITFAEEDFVATAQAAKELMAGPQGGSIIDVLKPTEAGDSLSLMLPEPDAKPKRNAAVPTPEPEPEDVDRSIVYLTADSPYTLERLEPNTSYVVGGIIDRNRHKGLCYKVARERKVRTAKLPIGEYMVLHDRHVLATNHVVEIMLRWLELGDWGAAFMKVIPTRKGGKLKDDADEPEDAARDEEDAEDAEDVEEETAETEAAAPPASTDKVQDSEASTGAATTAATD